MPKKKVLFLNILGTHEKEIEKRIYAGKTYGEYFRNRFKIPHREFLEINCFTGPFPSLKDVRFIVMGGSLADVTKKRERPWVERTFSFIRRAVRNHVPIVGFCGGLQFTVRALGGSVVYNPAGRDMGTKSMRLLPAGRKDFFFKGIPVNFLAQESHKCMVKRLPIGSILLATSRKTKIEAIAIGDAIRLTQFHPELTKAHIARLARMRKSKLIEEGFLGEKDFKKFISSLKPADAMGKKMITNFITRFSA